MGATIGSPECSPCPRRARGFYACTCVRGRASVRAFALNALIACLLQVCCLEIRRRYYCTAYFSSEKIAFTFLYDVFNLFQLL